MSRQYPQSLLRQVLKIQLSRLMPKAKTNAHRSKRQQPQTAFFKLQPPAASLGAESLTPPSSTDCRVQLERPDGARLSLTLPSLGLQMINLVRKINRLLVYQELKFSKEMYSMITLFRDHHHV